MTLTQIAQIFSIGTSCVVIIAGLYGFFRFTKRLLKARRQMRGREPEAAE
jgi:hypothetical protein